MSAQLKDLTRLQQVPQARTGLVKVSYGVHHLEVAIAGKSVGEVRQALREPLNIDPPGPGPGQRPGRGGFLSPEGGRPAGVRPPGRGKGWAALPPLTAELKKVKFNREVEY
jgi:hypothetical protein